MAEVEARDPETIQREIEARRRDLAVSINELREVASETLDPRKRVQRLVERSKVQTRLAMQRADAAARDRPALVAGIAAAVLGLVVVGLFAGRREPEPQNWLERWLDRHAE